MEPWTRVKGIAAPLPMDNVDTDAIIPSRETQSVVRTGYGEKLFANWRYEPGTRLVNPQFVLNQEPFNAAVFLVVGSNFGCGSSREAAVWSLQQFGIRAVIGESFGAIFYNNCLRNSVLPVALKKREVASILHYIDTCRGDPTLEVDLEQCTVLLPDHRFCFSIDPRDREMLLSGADEVELTLRKRAKIEQFRINDRTCRPWVYQRHRRMNPKGERKS